MNRQVLAREVHICEVGPRDGLQNAKHLMPTEAKKAWISALAAAGLEEIEVGSFVPPKLIPAMADTGEIVSFAKTIPGVKVVALAPNLKGFQRALEAGAHKVTFPVSASRAHSESNVRMTPDQMVEEVRKCARHPHPGGRDRRRGVDRVRLHAAGRGARGRSGAHRRRSSPSSATASRLRTPSGTRTPLRSSGFSIESETKSARSLKALISTTRAALASPTRSPLTRKAYATSTAPWAASAAARSRRARAAT